jgi:hypothetical protein
MNTIDPTAVFSLFYAIGELLTMTWPGRLVLGVVIGSMLSRFARA